MTCSGRDFAIHAHVLEATSLEVAQLRTFRDHLRADPKLRAAYVARKREILESGITDPAVYTGLKGAFIRQALEGQARPGESPDGARGRGGDGVKGGTGRGGDGVTGRGKAGGSSHA
jgi:hypothetical protein